MIGTPHHRFALLLSVLLCACSPKDKEPSPDLNAAIDAIFRMEGDPIQDRDVARTVEELFVYWIRDPDEFSALVPGLPLGGETIRLRLTEEVSRHDPLDLKRFGPVQLVEQVDALGFMGKNDEGKTLRLYLIDLPETPRRGLTSYHSAAESFADDLFKLSPKLPKTGNAEQDSGGDP